MKFKPHFLFNLFVLVFLCGITVSADATNTTPTTNTTTTPTTDGTQQTTPAPVQVVQDPNYNPIACSKDAVTVLGIKDMISNEKSVKRGFPACPRIKNACCNAADATKFIGFWDDKVKPRLDTFFTAQSKVYTTLFEALDKSETRARKIMSSNNDKIASECKIMAQTLSTCRIPDVTSNLKAVISKCHNFLSEAYKSLLCSFCDGDKHTLINVSSKKLISVLKTAERLVIAVTLSCYTSMLILCQF